MLFEKAALFYVSFCFLHALSESVEENEREIFLQPRNFNPHPYQPKYGVRIRGGGNTGPVLFPETPPDPDDPNGNSGNINGDRDNRLSIDSHPYASVVRKHKYKQVGRFHEQDDSNANPQALKALAAHAEKVLNKKLTSDIQSSLSDVSIKEKRFLEEKKVYAFSYKVRDQLSGDDFSHSQQQNAKATNGEYRVKLPDGRVQIVSYVADKNGYKADVKYAQNENSDGGAYRVRTQQIRPIQIVENRIRARPGHYDYVYEDYPSDSNLQTQLPLYDEDYETSRLSLYPSHDSGISALKDRNLVQLIVTQATPKITAAPPYENQIQINPYLILASDIRTHDVPEQKVQVFGNIHDQHKLLRISENSLDNPKVGKFIGSTLAPYTLDSTKGFQQNVLSTFSPEEDGYSQVRINTPSFRLLRKQHHQELFFKK